MTRSTGVPPVNKPGAEKEGERDARPHIIGPAYPWFAAPQKRV